jgi:hypothetical protein
MISRPVATLEHEHPRVTTSPPASRIAPRWWDAGAAIVIGLVVAVPLIGVARIDPSNLAWLNGDPATGYVGWAFYRHEEGWRFPLTWSERIGWPLGVTISWLDSIPLVAVLLRPFSDLLPEPFQYLGLWACLCFVLQAYFALRLGRVLFRDDPTFAIATAALVTGAPAVTWRMFGHHALASHWLIVASLWCYFRDGSRLASWRRLLPFVGVIAVAGAVSPYPAVLCLLVAIAAVGRLLFERRCTVVQGAIFVALLAGCMTTSLVVFGFAMPGLGSADYEGAGYGYFSMNLLAPINPMSYGSVLLPALPVAAYGQYEGYNYLGLGVIALWAIDLVFRPRAVLSLLDRRTAPLAVLAVLCTIAAASSTVTIGSVTVASVQLPGAVQSIVNALRASGRLFWPVHYLLILTAVVATHRAWPRSWREGLLIGALVLQIADLAGLRDQVRGSIEVAQAAPSPLRSPRWRELARDHERLIVLPAWECGSEESPGGFQGFATFGILAAGQRLATNDYHAGRMTKAQRTVHCRDLPAALASAASLDPRTAYVVADKFAIAWGLEGTAAHRCEVVDGFNLCARSAHAIAPRLDPAHADRIGTYAMGQWLDFRSSGNAAPYLWLGWSSPEPWGTWSDWGEASLLLRPVPARPVELTVQAKLRAYLSDRHPTLAVTIVANEQAVGRWDFIAGQPEKRRVHIPAAVVARSPLLHLRFAIETPVSPASLGISIDDRTLGIGMEALRIVRTDRGPAARAGGGGDTVGVSRD